MDFNLNFGGGHGTALIASILQNATDSEVEALLRSLTASSSGQQQQATPHRDVAAFALAAQHSPNTVNSSNDVAANWRTLLMLQQASQPTQPLSLPQPLPERSTDLLADLQLARLRSAPGLESLLASIAPPPPPPPQPPQLSNLELLRFRTAIAAAPASGGSDLLEEARLLQAINSHQQALANVEEAERHLAMLLRGTNSAQGSPTVPPAAPHITPSEASLPLATTTRDTRMVSNPTKCPPCLPPVEEGNSPHWSQRITIPLGMDEDANWLSERQCYIRSEFLEVVRASHEDVLVRSSSKSIAYQQAGIRCRYCAHLPAGSRAIRASAFPSSIRQMYQSFTMMVRDHFGHCIGVPPDKQQKFLKLKELTSPSSSLSRQYWAFAARKLGMRDSEYGIVINEETQAEAQKMPPFGTSIEETKAIQESRVELLVDPNDQNTISPYLYFLMSQAQLVSLLPSEIVGKRKDVAAGLPGFGCTHCAKVGRLGFCRMFPLNKRSLPDKVNDFYNHIMRCPKCPPMTKRLLESRRAEQESNRMFAERDRDFIDRIWIKLGRDCDEAFKKSQNPTVK